MAARRNKPSAQQAVVIPAGSNNIQPAEVMPLSFVRPEEVADRGEAAQDGSGYYGWKAFSEQLRHDPDLIAYYPFEKEDEDSGRRPTGRSPLLDITTCVWARSPLPRLPPGHPAAGRKSAASSSVQAAQRL